jgi:magnesium chelatase family protein
MNPCPCGHSGDETRRCRCTPDQIARYRGRLSGPLLDRIDLQITVPRVPTAALLSPAGDVEDSASVRERVCAARERQLRRREHCNALLTPAELEQDAPLDDAARDLLRQASERLDLSARAHHRLRRVARTIADLAGRDRVQTTDLAEAIRYREVRMP